MARSISAKAVSEFAQQSAMAGNERGRTVRNHWPQVLRASETCKTVKLDTSNLEHAKFCKGVGKLPAGKQCLPRLLFRL